MRRLFAGIFIITASLVTAASAAPVQQSAKTSSVKRTPPGVNPKAERVLRRMCNFLSQIPSFSCTTDNTFEIVLDTGQKLQFLSNSTLYVRRPNMMRSDRVGNIGDQQFYYNGRSFTMYGRNTNLFASTPAPSDLDAAIDDARLRLGLEAPAADLLYSNLYQVLMEDAITGYYIDQSDVRGITCDHLAYRGHEVDWQIWIDAGSTPLPRRFVITSKKLPGAPDYSVTMYNWNTSTQIPSNVFNFAAPPDAKKVDFFTVGKTTQPVRARSEELP